jgi:hypothetical protein
MSSVEPFPDEDRSRAPDGGGQGDVRFFDVAAFGLHWHFEPGSEAKEMGEDFLVEMARKVGSGRA